MGQYHRIVNLDKREYLNPPRFHEGTKLWEFAGGQTTVALVFLLAAHNGRGGGDMPKHNLAGSWAGDRIAIVGDYEDESDTISLKDLFPELVDGETSCIYGATEDHFKDVSAAVLELIRESA